MSQEHCFSFVTIVSCGNLTATTPYEYALRQEFVSSSVDLSPFQQSANQG